MSETDRGDVLIETELCKGCFLCVAACPPTVLAESRLLNRQGYYPVTYLGSGCTGCGACFYCSSRIRRNHSSSAEKRVMRELVNGNEAIVRGAILAGCRAFFGYPITAASEIAEKLQPFGCLRWKESSFRRRVKLPLFTWHMAQLPLACGC